MLSVTFAVLMSCPFLALRLTGAAGSFPKPLSAKEEAYYIEQFAAGDTEARNVLIERNLRLVAHIIKKYYTQISDQDDLISIGTIGLIKGITTYRADRGVRLATYASRCIENEILMHFRSQRRTAGEVSLSESIDTDNDGNSLSLMDVISVDDDMLDSLSADETVTRLRGFIAGVLTDRERWIISMRYGLGDMPPRTQREIAAECGISRSYVSRRR